MAQTLYPLVTAAGIALGNPMVADYKQTAAAALSEVNIFVAPFACKVRSVKATWGTAAGATSTIAITKETGTTAPAGGTTILAAAMDFNGTANTPITPALSATASDYTLAAGDRLSTKIASGTATGNAKVLIEVLIDKI